MGWTRKLQGAFELCYSIIKRQLWVPIIALKQNKEERDEWEKKKMKIQRERGIEQMNSEHHSGSFITDLRYLLKACSTCKLDIHTYVYRV